MLSAVLFVYQWLIFIPLMFISTIITALTVILGASFGSEWMVFKPCILWARLWCWLMFVKVDIRGRENIDKATSYVFIANHQSAYDIYAIFGFLNHNFRWMMKKSLEKLPLIGRACRVAGHIMVDRSTPRAIIRTMQDAREKLKGGRSIVVFPEGSRTHDGKLQPFKSGAFKLATDFRLPLVPITIDGAYEVMKRDSFKITPGTITITIHHPIPSPRRPEEKEQVMKEAYDIIQSALSTK